MISILLSAVIGYYAHRWFKPVSDRFPAGWDILSNYSAGGVIILLVYSLFYLVELRKMPHGWQRATLALVLDLFGIGGGTSAAWVEDTIRQRPAKKSVRKNGLGA